MFYTYLWLREDGTPYYVGKGKGRRALEKHRIGNAPKGRIVLYIHLSEAESLETETALIWYYGRKDLSTGCLRNLTDGGEGATGVQRTEEQRAHLSKVKTGIRHSETHRINNGKARKGKPMPTETKKLIGDALRGRSKPPFSEAHRRRIGEHRINNPVTYTPEYRQKLRDAANKRWNNVPKKSG